MTLFENFEYKNKKELIEFLNELDNKNALTLIELSLSHAAKQGCFDIDESYCIFMCLSELRKYYSKEINE